jgi:pyruvate dehydrogenase E2 component (dihydrolipoamide acetyltransferase)
MTAHRVEHADRVPPREVARELTGAARRIRRGEDPQFGRSTSLARLAPGFLTRTGMSLSGYVAGALGRAVPGVGLAAHPFGSALVSSVAAWDLRQVAPPLIPFARLGMVAVLGAAEDRAVVRGGEVVPRRMADLTLTLDHRLMDGAQAGHLLSVLRPAVEDPESVWPD